MLRECWRPDVDGDGDVDLYIGNDIHPNFLYLNTGGGEFSNVTEISGTAYDRNGQMQAGMGVAGGDVNPGWTVGFVRDKF